VGYAKPGRYPEEKKAGGKLEYLCPEGGLFAALTKGRKQTKNPAFGAIALFYDKDNTEIDHAAVVLGRSQKGEVYLVQKINASRPYGVSSVNHPLIRPWDPVYSQ
jgi:hypothetical protein